MKDEHMRPNPDQLLSIIKKDEQESQSGKLKIFLGMAAGVGKTYAMLSQAHSQKNSGVDVVVGWVDTHGRADTARLTEGLEILPRKEVPFQGTILHEFDLDLALQRKPKLIVVDELAHTNVPGMRHDKRYLDVLELLNAGIDVYTAINIQHLESRVETVHDITGIEIRETVPDLIFDRANEVVLIDIPPDDLLRRLADGKIYGKERADAAARNFFRPGNLTALRELALRITAERVDRDVRQFKTLNGIESAWKSSARLMVAVYASPYSESLIRQTRRFADSMNASWIGAYVQGDQHLSSEEEGLLAANMDLVRQLGGEMITTKDSDPVLGLIRVARQNNVTQVILGKSRRTALGNWLRGGSVADRINRASGDMDVLTISTRQDKVLYRFRRRLTKSEWFVPADEIGKGIATLIVTWLIAAALRPFIGYMAVGVIFLVAVNIASLVLSRAAIIALAFAFALIHDVFFIPPLFTFQVREPQDMLLLGSLFVAAMVTGSLTGRLRRKEVLLHHREKLNGVFFSLAKTLSATVGLNDIAFHAVTAMEQAIGPGFSFFAKSKFDDAMLPVSYPIGSDVLLDDKEAAVKDWVHRSGQPAGRGTQTLSSARGLFLPVKGREGLLGVIAYHSDGGRTLSVEDRSIIDTICSIVSPAIEREFLTEDQLSKRVTDESEKLYRTLLDSVSHELKTPLVSIKGAGSVLKDNALNIDPSMRIEMANQIVMGSERLQQVVDDLLDMTRLESGKLRPRIELHDANDVVGNVIANLSDEQRKRVAFMPLQSSASIFCDSVLAAHAILNIIRNGLMYSPSDETVEVVVKEAENSIEIAIMDRGPGVEPGLVSRLFEKFYRGSRERSGGLGLGLSIARGFVELQKGAITVVARYPHGSIFSIYLPRGAEATEVPT